MVKFRRENRVTVRLLDCWNAPSVACPSASGEDSAVLAAKTRPFTLSMSTNENLASTLSSRSFIFRPMALALGSACAWHARVNASPMWRAVSVWLTRTTTASARSSTCGACAGPASGEGTPSPRKATAPHSSSTIRYWGGALARFALTLALRGMEAGVQKSQGGARFSASGKKRRECRRRDVRAWRPSREREPTAGAKTRNTRPAWSRSRPAVGRKVAARGTHLASSGSSTSRGLSTTANKARPGAVIGGLSLPETSPQAAVFPPPLRGLDIERFAGPTTPRMRLRGGARCVAVRPSGVKGNGERGR